ncbi:hypothetical protein L0128_14355 [candidate division KSB1 bacterium]|nr:hypothetical protein [candidate division KSB1 bacterium]
MVPRTQCVPDGSIETDGGLALRVRDLAKIGQLFLNQGKWNDQQIFAPGWVEAATTERLKFGKFLKWGYRYSWMQFDSQVRDKVIHSYFVPGDGEQLLAVFPELNLVIVFTAGNYGTDPKGKYYSLLGQYVLPAMGNP